MWRSSSPNELTKSGVSLRSGNSASACGELPQGKVLVTGGFYTDTIKTAELYDPATGLWTQVASMATGRFDHSFTLLPNGQVLAAGGLDNQRNDLLSAELYNPVTNTWTATAPMSAPHYDHRVAPLLPSGKVMVTGRASAELYDPVTQTWSPAGNHFSARSAHTVTLLSSGKVLVAGGGGTSLAEISP